MEEDANKTANKDIRSNKICKQIESNGLVWQENITIIDLTGRNIEDLSDDVKLPANLLQLSLSHNKLAKVPKVALKLQNLKVLDLSYNKIIYFDDVPNFCHALERLDLSVNMLEGPPYWIWTEAPKNLSYLNLSDNLTITKSLVDGYFEELLQYSVPVTELEMYNCRLIKFVELIGTFSKVKSLCLGVDDLKLLNGNSFIEIPCKGLDKCCDIERLNVCNTHIYTINPSIEIYRNLVNLNLAQNNLHSLPNEFCNLMNLETCVLSYNKILYLPEDMHKLHKLIRLYLNTNELCMLPESLSTLPSLKTLDLYDNHLNEIVGSYRHLEEIDLAQNYFDEPVDRGYLERKEKLRLLYDSRCNGRKYEMDQSNEDEKETSEDEDDEELYDLLYKGKPPEEPPNHVPDPPSSPEDWDSDDYWVPRLHHFPPPTQSRWLVYIKRKMEEGNFCPMDAHTVSVAEKVRYEKMCNPQVDYFPDGQFDDCSSDES